jgi:hypothetical protein
MLTTYGVPQAMRLGRCSNAESSISPDHDRPHVAPANKIEDHPMSDFLAGETLPLVNETTKNAPPSRFVAAFKAMMESLVAAQRGRFSDNEPLLYRFPPL